MVKATVQRVVNLGFETRVELLAAASGDEFAAQITRGDQNALALQAGETVYARATKGRCVRRLAVSAHTRPGRV